MTDLYSVCSYTIGLLAVFFSVARPPVIWPWPGRGPITPPGPVIVSMDQKNLNLKNCLLCLRPNPSSHRRRAGPRAGGGDPGGQVQGLSYGSDQRWQHSDAHRLPERSPRGCDGLSPERCPAPHAQQGNVTAMLCSKRLGNLKFGMRRIRYLWSMHV